LKTGEQVMDCNFQTVGSAGTASMITLNAVVNSSTLGPESLRKASVSTNSSGRPNAIEMVGKRDEQEERIACLQELIAVLIEKNERMRMQLMQA
jgi:hypothetical protein